MKKNKNKNRVLSDFNPILWQQAEKEEARLQEKINGLCSARVDYLSKRLNGLKNNSGESVEKKEEYYKLRDELVILCQKGFLGLGLSVKDKNWAWSGLLCLSNLYKDLIERIAKGCVIKYDNQVDFNDVKSYAQQLFWRLITGDTPWAIEAFANQENPSHETKAALSNIQIHKTKKEVQSSLSQLVNVLKKANLHPEDIKLTEFLFQEDMKRLGDWINQPTLSFPNWVRATINRQIKLRQNRLSLKLVKNQKQANKYQKDIAKLQKILKDNDLFYALIGKNILFFARGYEKYKKGCYKNEKYESYRGVNFTTYIEKYLAWELSNLYKRKELKRRPLVSFDKYEDWYNPNQNQDYSPIGVKGSIEDIKAKLTPRENDVFPLMLRGLKNTDIADNLSISRGRVSQLVKNIRDKASKVLSG